MNYWLLTNRYLVYGKMVNFMSASIDLGVLLDAVMPQLIKNCKICGYNLSQAWGGDKTLVRFS